MSDTKKEEFRYDLADLLYDEYAYGMYSYYPRCLDKADEIIKLIDSYRKRKLNMCCEPRGAECTSKAWKARVECPKCGAWCAIEEDDYVAFDICAYSSGECEFCGSAPCDESC